MTMPQRELRLLSTTFVRYELLIARMMLGGALYGAVGGMLIGVAGLLVIRRRPTG